MPAPTTHTSTSRSPRSGSRSGAGLAEAAYQESMCLVPATMVSAGGQVPRVVERRNVGLVILHLAAARGGVQRGEALAEVFAGELAALEDAECLRPGQRNRVCSVAVGGARQHGARIEL